MERRMAVALALFFIIAGPTCLAFTAPVSGLEVHPLLIIDFGSSLPDSLEALEASGFEVVAFLPPSSVLVLPPANDESLPALPAQATVSHLQPCGKLSFLLEDYLTGQGKLPVTVLFSGFRQELENTLELRGCTASSWGQGSVEVQADNGDVWSLALLGNTYWIEPAPPPLAVNDNACRILGVRQWSDGAFANDSSSFWSYNTATGTFEGLTGAGVNVSVADSGIDGTHPGFSGRMTAFINYAGTGSWIDQGSSESGHGTMCAGIVAGNGAWRPADPGGQPGKYTGMAPGAGLVGQAIFQRMPTIPVLCRDAYQSGAQVQSNSWGYYNTQGAYLSQSADYDTAVRDADPGVPGDQSLIVVIAAGNNGSSSMTVIAPSTAKNVITVGATGNDKAGSSWGPVASSRIVDFSGRGPCADGRLKPDLCAPGIDTYTASAQNSVYKSPSYDYLGRVPDDPDSSSYFAGGGTSAAAPYVAGACALTVAFWRSQYGMDPSPALTKALLINGAEPLPGYAYPGNDQGWGRINVTRSLLPKPDRNILTNDQIYPLNTGEARSMWINVSASRELKLSLVWTDEPGSPAAGRELVNDLDLVVTDPEGNIFYGNNFASGQSIPGGSPDSLNNVEGLLMSTPKPGRWSVEVRGSGVNSGPQDYAMVVSGPVREITADPAAVAVSHLPPEPFEGDMISLNFTVQNLGIGPATGFPYCITMDSVSLQEGVLPDLPAGQSVQVPADWTAMRGNHSLGIIINPFGTVDETSQTNDRLQLNVTVLNFGVGVDASPGTIMLDPGSTGVFQGTVTNIGTAPDKLTINFTSDAPGWTTSAEPALILLATQGTANISLNVTCPPEALAGATANLTFTAMSLGNCTCTSSATLSAVARQIFSINISSPPPIQVYPWETAEFNLTATNSGNGDDNVNLTVKADRQDWQVGLSSETLLLGPRSAGPLGVTVSPPADSMAGNLSTVTLTARSAGGFNTSAVLAVTVRQFFGIDLVLSLLNDSARPGGRVEAVYFLHNLGNGPDMMELVLDAEPGWIGDFNGSVLLNGSVNRTIGGRSMVTVPQGALAGDYPLQFIARSSGGPVASANFTIRVEQVFSVASSAGPWRQVVFQGEPVSLLVSVTNLGNGNDTFDIFPEGLPGHASFLKNIGPIPLVPGAVSSAMISVSNLSFPGQFIIVIRAVSRGNPGTVNLSSMEILVLAIPSVPALLSEEPLFANVPTVGGTWEPCGAVLVLTAAIASLIVVKRPRPELVPPPVKRRRPPPGPHFNERNP